MKTILLSAFTLLCLGASAQSSLDSLFSKSLVSGVQLQYIDGNKIQNYFYGNPRPDREAGINGQTIFQAASLSKTVLAYITLRLCDRKILSLDTPLSRYFNYPRIKADTAAARITARMVLHHVSGLPNWAANPSSDAWINSPLKTNFTPGSSWAYSGEGFMYLQFAIEQLTQQSLDTLARQEVFVPLQMTQSSFIWQESYDPVGAYGHNAQGQPTGRAGFAKASGAFSLYTTATDFSRFVQALMRGRGLTKKMHRQMLNNRVGVKRANAPGGESVSHIFWGLGLAIQENENGTAIWHWGNNGDFKCFFFAFPKQKKSLVYLTNSENGLKVMKEVLNHFLGKQNWWADKWLEEDF